MTYAQFGTVQATDYNNFVGSNPSTTANRLNTVWATGGGSAGYGQTSLSQVSAGGTVTATSWANLINDIALAALHQGSTITAVSAPAAGGKITYLSAISNNLTTIYNNRLNATAQGATSTNTQTYSSTWTNTLTCQHTVTFTSGDTARYFFNAGGQITISCSYPTGSGFNATLSDLASNIGTVVLSAPISGTATIASTSYTGITQLGGSGNTPTISTNNGYYALNSSNAQVFLQTGTSGFVYTSYGRIRVIVKSNGTQGSNGDAGSVITIYTVWDDIPTATTINSGAATTCSVIVPSTSNITNSWGVVGLAGTVSAT
jgi:hypothetical protein